MTKTSDESDDFSIKKSMEFIGVLYPALQDNKGRIIDGKHRLKDVPNWPVFQLDHINNEAKFRVATLVTNWHRRTVSAEEKTKLLDGIAEVTGWTPKKIAENVGLHERTVRRYLSDKYKNSEMRHRRMIAEKKKMSIRENPVDRLSTEKARISPITQIPKTEDEEPRQFAPKPAPKDEAKQGIVIEYDLKKADDKDQFIDGFDLWFLPASDPVVDALYRYCKEKQVHWQEAVRDMLAEFLRKQGFLDED